MSHYMVFYLLLNKLKEKKQRMRPGVWVSCKNTISFNFNTGEKLRTSKYVVIIYFERR